MKTTELQKRFGTPTFRRRIKVGVNVFSRSGLKGGGQLDGGEKVGNKPVLVPFFMGDFFL